MIFSDNEVYIYKEGRTVLEVKIIKNKSDSEFYHLTLIITKVLNDNKFQVGQKFHVSSTIKDFNFYGGWRLFPAKEVMHYYEMFDNQK